MADGQVQCLQKQKVEDKVVSVFVRRTHPVQAGIGWPMPILKGDSVARFSPRQFYPRGRNP